MDPVVKTRQGAVRGRRVNGVHVFKGIPYAAPPFGLDRLRPPQPVESWSGTRDALTYGPKSPQLPYPPPIDHLMPELVSSGEDCLTLNVWSADLGSARQPVMVWIPGGMFEFHGTAASPWYDGSRFARDGVVCTTINYRVGAEGFLYLSDLSDGNVNRGLLDQIAALEWVRENIAAFGGDPGNVTIFGESAGAMSVATLLAIPRAAGLFRRVIAQSGAAHHAISPATAMLVGQQLSARLGAVPSVDAIAAVPMERLLRAQAALHADLDVDPDPTRWGHEVAVSLMPWQPVIDGEVLPARPIDRIAAGGAGGHIDILVGTNTDEHRMFLATSGAIERVTSEVLVGVLTTYGLAVQPTLAAYRAAHPGGKPGDLLAAIQTDWYWRIPALRLADAHATSLSTTYMYEFAWRSPQFAGRLGACHALEIPFVFDTLGSGTDTLWGATPPQELADIMHTAWVEFATHGDPGWPRYDLRQRATMRFDVIPEVVDDPRSGERELWKGVR